MQINNNQHKPAFGNSAKVIVHIPQWTKEVQAKTLSKLEKNVIQPVISNLDEQLSEKIFVTSGHYTRPVDHNGEKIDGFLTEGKPAELNYVLDTYAGDEEKTFHRGMFGKGERGLNRIVKNVTEFLTGNKQ